MKLVTKWITIQTNGSKFAVAASLFTLCALAGAQDSQKSVPMFLNNQLKVIRWLPHGISTRVKVADPEIGCILQAEEQAKSKVDVVIYFKPKIRIFVQAPIDKDTSHQYQTVNAFADPLCPTIAEIFQWCKIDPPTEYVTP